MSVEEKITRAIHHSIDEINQNLDHSKLISKDPQAILFGSGILDSVDFVSLVLLIEENIGHELGVELDLMGEDFLMEDGNSFSTIKTLVAYVQKTYSRVKS